MDDKIAAEARVIADAFQRLFEDYGITKVHFSEEFARGAYIYAIPLADHRRIVAVSEDYIEDTPGGFGNRFAQLQVLCRNVLDCPGDAFLFVASEAEARLVPLTRLRSDEPW